MIARAAEERVKARRLSRLSGAAAPALKPVTTFDDRALRRALYVHGRDAVRDAYLFAIAASEEAVETADIRKRLADSEDWARPSLPVRGGDFQALGLKGKAIGEAMREAEQAFIDSDFSLSRDALLSLRKQ